MTVTTFKNRREAGKLLAQTLKEKSLGDAIVLALPWGGILIADEIARVLKTPHAILAARKVEAPTDPDSTVAAIAPLNIVVVDPYAQESYDISERELNALVATEKKEMERIEHAYSRPTSETHSTVIIVDDGLSSVISLRAAIESARIRYNPHHIIFASPVCGRDTVVSLENYVDDVVCLSMPDDLIEINLWYDEAESISDWEIRQYIT
jgi:predicted phosphoribosyltransferase